MARTPLLRSLKDLARLVGTSKRTGIPVEDVKAGLSRRRLLQGAVIGAATLAAPQGGVYFCGEHTSTDFQGFMEGGASTGKDTAKLLASLL